MLQKTLSILKAGLRLARPRRRWARFSLFKLLLAVTAACALLGIITGRARDQVALVKAIRDAGGYVEYSYQTDESGKSLPEDEWSEPPLLVRWFGEGYADVTYAHVPYFFESSDEQINAMSRCTKLRWLNWEAFGLRDEQFLKFRGMTRLRRLSLRFSSITDAGLAALSDMTELESLRLEGAELTISWPESPGAIRPAP